jgi:hypothetical protein
MDVVARRRDQAVEQLTSVLDGRINEVTKMSITTFYRLCVWLPLVVPAVLIVAVNAFDLRDPVGWVGEVVGFSLFYGGGPYLLLALWATWWIRGRTEPEIRRVMFRAPLYMLGAFVPLALLIGLAVGAPGPWTGVAGLGAVSILALGYSYVGLTALLRAAAGRRLVA